MRSHASRASGRLASAGGMQLLENVVDVILNGADLDAQSGGDLLIGKSLVNQRQDPTLALRQRGIFRRGRTALR